MNRTVRALILCVLLVLLMAPAARAATSQEIYDDYAKNGTFTGTYTLAELEAALNDGTIHQYGSPSVVLGVDILIKAVLAEMSEGKTFAQALASVSGAVETSTADGESSGRQTVPFTGAWIGLAAAAGLAMVACGWWLRRSKVSGAHK